MNSLLVVNLSTEPKKLTVASLVDGQFKVIESQEILLAPPPAIPSDSSTPSDHGIHSGTNTEDENKSSVAGEISENNPGSTTAENPDTPESGLPEPADLSAALRASLAKLNSRWQSSAVICNPATYYSVNIELPFKEEKIVSKIINTEIQDLLTFDMADFAMDHKVVGSGSDHNYDVHIALASKSELSQLLTDCKRAALDPVAIAPISSLFEGLIWANPEQYCENCCWLYFNGTEVTLVFRVNSQIRADRIIRTKSLLASNIVSEIKRSLVSVETKYGVTLDNLYFNSSAIPPSALSAAELFSSLQNNLAGKNCITQQDVGEDLAVELLKALGDKEDADNLLVNFRSGEFAKVLSLENIWQIFRPLFPYFLLAVLLSSAALFASFISKEQEIQTLRQAVTEKVVSILGDKNLAADQIVKSIQDKNSLIEKQLRELGSPSKFSPLDVLVELVKDFSGNSAVNMQSLSVRGTELVLIGTASSYEAVDAVEKVFMEKKTFYCHFSKQVSGSTTRQFTFNVSLCD